MAPFRVLVVALLALIFGGLARAADDLAAHFFDAENIADYVKTVDGLIAQGEAQVFAAPEEAKGKAPQAKTKNGILMVYTIYEMPEGAVHHFSVSCAPYLATPFGTDLVALFGDRAGLPFPPKMSISERQVFHATWFFPKENAASEKKAAAKRREQNRAEPDAKKVFGAAVMKAGALRPGGK